MDGSEELYDHDNDPNEFTNLYKDSNYADVKDRLRARLPKVDMPSWQSEDGSMKLNVDITCNHNDVTVKRCPGAGNVAGTDSAYQCQTDGTSQPGKIE